MELDKIFVKPFLNIDMNEILKESVQMNSAFVANENYKQLDKGLNSDETPITNAYTGRDTYSPSYAKYKGKLKPIDLLDTNRFRSTIKPDTDSYKEGFEMTATDSKTGKLFDMFGELIVGLTKKAIYEVGEFIKPDVQTKFKNKLFA